MEQCKFCNNMFGDKKMLGRHQKNTKYCIKIQDTKAKEDADALVKSLEEAKDKEIEENKAKERKEAEELEKSKELTCQFCSKKFKTKYLLRIHQTQAKYCLKIQESQNSQEIIADLVICKFCSKNFSSSHFNRHDLTCKKKLEFLLNKKDQEIAILKIEKEIEISSIYKASAESSKALAERAQAATERAQATLNDIARQPTYQKNSTKNIQNNLMISSLTPLDLSQARVDSIIDEKYTKNDFYEGQKGAAQIIHKHILTDSEGKSQIVCTDTERGTFHHIDLNGEHVIDYKNSHLIDKVRLPLKRKAGKFAAEECVKKPEAFKEIIMNESSIRELEIRPGLFNRTIAQLTGKNCAKQLIDQPANLSITKEWLLENAKFLTIEHILRGLEGYADYALSYPLNDRLIIDDDYYDSEHKVEFLKYKDSKGDIIVDVNGLLLGKMIIDSLDDRIKTLIKDNDLDQVEDILMSEFIEIILNNI